MLTRHNCLHKVFFLILTVLMVGIGVGVRYKVENCKGLISLLEGVDEF